MDSSQSSLAPQAHLDLLEELSVDEHPHSGRTLLEHLSGTRDLLAAWGNGPEVCAAGLFHSIYGTAYYKIQSASLDRRGDVAAVIGAQAEQLAFLFCVTDRTGFLEQASSVEPVLNDRVHEASIRVSPETIDALLEIEMANCVEQIDPARAKPGTADRLQQMQDRARGHVSAGANAALAELVGRCRAVESDSESVAAVKPPAG